MTESYTLHDGYNMQFYAFSSTKSLYSEVLLKVFDQHCKCLLLLCLVDAGIYHERNPQVQPCHAVSNLVGTP